MNGRLPADPRTIRERFVELEEQISLACRRAGRARAEVALMAVSKMHSVAAILEAASLGIALFGENRVQEFQEKRTEILRRGYHISPLSIPPLSIPPMTEAEPALPISPLPISPLLEVHLIGHLQSNKSARAVELFSAIDTLDSVHLADRLNHTAAESGRCLPVMLEIKLSPEESKSGLEPESAELRDLLERLPALDALELRGMMTVPPWSEDPEAARPYFRRLRGLRDQFAAAYPRLRFSELSMGMSHDFAVAIEEGATEIRIGTGLFGPRRREEPPLTA
jgi:PLP dependent protein